MNCLQEEQRVINQRDQFQGSLTWRAIETSDVARKPAARATAPEKEARLPYSEYREETCEQCGGDGVEPGSLDPHEHERCGTCGGSGKELVFHEWLAEALRIAGEPIPGYHPAVPRREHVVAIVAYCREHVSLLSKLPEVA